MEKFLYPYKNPYIQKYLQVDQIHKLKISKFGNKSGIPVIFLHGGPGAPTDEYCSRFFDKRYYNIILFDQRGCGESKPLGELKNNNTENIINDIEKIRIDCRFKKFIIFGGSWGASLAILYSITYPDKVITFIIRDICLMDSPIFTNSFKEMYPEYWNKFLKTSGTGDIHKAIEIYFKQIKNKNKLFINNWNNLEFKSLTVHLKDNPNDYSSFKKKYICALFESYFYHNNFFLESNFILTNCYKIKHLSGHIIHGRLDVICSPDDSFRLSENLPKSKLIIIESAGHSYLDPPLTCQLVKSTKFFASIYFKDRKSFYF